MTEMVWQLSQAKWYWKPLSLWISAHQLCQVGGQFGHEVNLGPVEQPESRFCNDLATFHILGVPHLCAGGMADRISDVELASEQLPRGREGVRVSSFPGQTSLKT